jgi:OmpA-OmpF porin, OOP family
MRRQFFVLLFSLSTSLQAQNLVPNPGFEQFAVCPGSMSLAAHEFNVPHWRGIGNATPDYFNRCGKGEADVPYNWAGVAEAYEGNGYAGIYTYLNMRDSSMDRNNYREYLQCQLLQPLVKDSSYIIEFRYKLSSYSMYAIDRIGLLLENSFLDVTHDNALELTPTLSIIQDSALTVNTGLWEVARMEYKARGGEQFLIIGNFFDWASTKNYRIQFRPIAEPMLADAAYYYIDDVKVLPRAANLETLLTQLIPEFGGETIKAGKSYVLKNIQFEFDSYALTNDSFAELNDLFDFLRKNSSIRIQLLGHTDDQGTDAYNDRLSYNRALQVSNYLISKGVRAERIEVFGYGKRSPLLSSNTDSARKINRRVEIRFLD